MTSASDFGTDAANQSGVDIKVMAGERDSTEPADCKDVGTATLTFPGGLPARSPIRVKFTISRDGRLSVTATDLTGGGRSTSSSKPRPSWEPRMSPSDPRLCGCSTCLESISPLERASHAHARSSKLRR